MKYAESRRTEQAEQLPPRVGPAVDAGPMSQPAGSAKRPKLSLKTSVTTSFIKYAALSNTSDLFPLDPLLGRVPTLSSHTVKANRRRSSTTPYQLSGNTRSILRNGPRRANGGSRPCTRRTSQKRRVEFDENVREYCTDDTAAMSSAKSQDESADSDEGAISMDPRPRFAYPRWSHPKAGDIWVWRPSSDAVQDIENDG